VNAIEILLRRSGSAKLGLWIVQASDAAAIVTGLFYGFYLQTLAPDANVTELDLVPSEIAYTVSGLAQLVAFVVCAVLFIRWFRVVYENTATISGAETAHKPSWTLWGFVVPFLNLIRPQQLMREAWTACENAWAHDPSHAIGLLRPTDPVNLWWGFFLATNIVSNAAGRLAWDATSAADTLNATWILMVADVLDLAAAFVAIKLVNEMTLAQKPLLEQAPPRAA
jgi:hypothetical protein